MDGKGGAAVSSFVTKKISNSEKMITAGQPFNYNSLKYIKNFARNNLWILIKTTHASQ